MIDGVILGASDLQFKVEGFKTVRPIENHIGVSIWSGNEFITMLDRKEIKILAQFLFDFLSDEDNK